MKNKLSKLGLLFAFIPIIGLLGLLIGYHSWKTGMYFLSLVAYPFWYFLPFPYQSRLWIGLLIEMAVLYGVGVLTIWSFHKKWYWWWLGLSIIVIVFTGFVGLPYLIFTGGH